jgi:hypothetical protein
MADLFEQSEGTRADLKNDLGIALLKCNANIYLAQLMIWVFNTTDRTKPLKKSYDELAARPWGLCCSRSQAYATVKKAERLGLLHAKPTYAGPGIQGANEYSIDWEGVHRIVGVRRGVTYTTTCDPPLTTCDPPLTTCDPPLTTCDASKEYTSSHLLTPLNTPATRQERGAAGLVLVRKSKTRTRESVLADVVPPDQVLAWQAILQRLLGLGVYADLCECLLVQLANRGATPDDVTALADHFQSRPGAWTAGALSLALKRWSPGQSYDAAALWPPAAETSRQWRF